MFAATRTPVSAGVGFGAPKPGATAGAAKPFGAAAGGGAFGAKPLLELQQEVRRLRQQEQATIVINGRSLHKVSFDFLAANFPAYRQRGALCDGCATTIQGHAAVWHAAPQVRLLF